MTNRKIHLYVNMIQVLVGICIFLLFCLASFLVGGKDMSSLWPIVFVTTKAAAFPILLYLLNFSLLIPKLLFSNRKLWFVLADIFVVAMAIVIPILRMETSDIQQVEQQLNGLSFVKLMAAAIIMKMALYICMIALAVGMRYMVRWNEERNKLEEERRRNTEAELNWLKNQLNPHFLFNTLNNISSLIQIDTDKAQESIGQLSELLRYALYESSSRKVRITDEVNFMSNYIDLMSLRCNEKTTLKLRFDRFDEKLMISPLLFVSLVENAFKHGTSAHRDSFITINMAMDGNDLVFSSENLVIGRPHADRSGSGIGIENMKRRLELLYPENYSYEQFVEDGIYVAIVRIKDIATHV